tara:strand:+ start:634 stop:1065 length:432 start_codon:yes stop_codon:yes gene_type:complete
MMYRRDGLIFTKLSDKSWSDPKIARIIPTSEGGSWGNFIDLKDTEWSKFVDVISSDSLDRALRGDCTPLMKEGLRQPRGCLKRSPLPKVCADHQKCTSYTPKLCTPKSQKAPECLSLGSDFPQSVRILISAWTEGYYVVREGK